LVGNKYGEWLIMPTDDLIEKTAIEYVENNGIYQDVYLPGLLPVKQSNNLIKSIEQHDNLLNTKYKSVMLPDSKLNRKIVSFQANKTIPIYRWYKYKEGFSAHLVEYYLKRYTNGKFNRLLDPFAGSGVALFCASNQGIESIGIEVLPIGQHIIKTHTLLDSLPDKDFNTLIKWKEQQPWIKHSNELDFIILNITKGAYPEENHNLIKRFLSAMQIENENVQAILLFALLCILEEISYTRKDGQYLRWDQRSGRCERALPFNKGDIRQFNVAMRDKLQDIISDIKGNSSPTLFDVSPVTNKKEI